jgi:membrane-associated phospholipid phosphatase
VTRLAALVLAALLVTAPARAQSLPIDRLTPSLPTAGERTAASVASWATAITAVVLDVNATIGKCDGQDECYRAVTFMALRLGVTYGAAFAAKKLVHRERPCAPLDCGIDNPDFSFYSAHTALAFSTLGGPRLAVSLPLAISTGGLRVAGGKHYLTDVLVGAGVGALTSRIR